MKDPAAAFFDALAKRGHEPSLEKVSATLRFDLTHKGRRSARWLVTIARGDVAVSGKNSAADCAVRVERSVFDDMVRGRTNGIAALLRGELTAEGDLELLAAFQRLFPGPPRAAS